MTDITEIFGGAIDAADAPAASGGDRTPLKEGTYEMMVLESELRSRDNGDECITIKFEVMGGDFNGRWHWNDYMTKCSGNPKRVEYSKNDLTRLVAACGLTSCTDLNQLTGLRFSVRVKHGGKKMNGDPYINLQGYAAAATPTPTDTVTAVAPDALDEVIGTDVQASAPKEEINDAIPF